MARRAAEAYYRGDPTKKNPDGGLRVTRWRRGAA
jgi:hypothetical protein